MAALHPDLRALVESGPLCHLATIDEDGRPHVTVVWVGLDGDDLVTGHMRRQRKLRNLERDPRAVLSFLAPAEPGTFLNPYAVVNATASIAPSSTDAWDLLDRLAKLYVAPGADFPAERAEGYLVRYAVDGVRGVGPWVE